MTNYEKAVRPVLRASDPITLKIGLTLNQIDLVGNLDTRVVTKLVHFIINVFKLNLEKNDAFF